MEALVKVWRPPERAMMPGLLMALGMSKKRVYCAVCAKGQVCHCGGFWAREEIIGLECIAYEAKQAFRQKAKRLRPDFIEHHKEAVELNRIWAKIKKLFLKRGIQL